MFYLPFLLSKNTREFDLIAGSKFCLSPIGSDSYNLKSTGQYILFLVYR